MDARNLKDLSICNVFEPNLETMHVTFTLIC